MSDLRELKAGEQLFAEGDPSDAAYFVEQGLLEVFKNIDGREAVLATLEPGDIVGEMALIDSGPRTAGVRVLEDAKVTALTEASVLARLEQSDPLIQLVLCVVLDRLRSSIHRLDDDAGAGPPAANTRTAQISSSLRSNVMDRARIERDLRAGFDAGELHLHYQPIMDLETLRPVGMEALLRWERPGLGMVSPGQFVAVAEQTDLILSIGRWIIEAGCRFLAESACDSSLYLSLNVATRQFEHDDIEQAVESALARSGADPTRLQIEITESALMNAPERAAAALRACRDLGCRVAIDDFGTGYSSLAYLLNFEVDCIKIDRSFVLGMRAGARGEKLLRGIAGLGRALDLKIIVEGAETVEEARKLHALGCQYGQGFVFSRPMAAEDVVTWLEQYNSKGA